MAYPTYTSEQSVHAGIATHQSVETWFWDGEFDEPERQRLHGLIDVRDREADRDREDDAARTARSLRLARAH